MIPIVVLGVGVCDQVSRLQEFDSMDISFDYPRVGIWICIPKDCLLFKSKKNIFPQPSSNVWVSHLGGLQQHNWTRLKILNAVICSGFLTKLDLRLNPHGLADMPTSIFMMGHWKRFENVSLTNTWIVTQRIKWLKLGISILSTSPQIFESRKSCLGIRGISNWAA